MTTLIKPNDIPETVAHALQEDVGNGDITAQLIPESTHATANLYCRDEAVLCGIPWVNEIFVQLDPTVSVNWTVNDGDPISQMQILATFAGQARSLLTAERCLLNFLQTLSATATLSSRFARMVEHTKVKLLDTRKTLPGLRTAQKYAVVVGGCFNHRFGLYDAFLIKENHITACGSIELAISKARKLNPGKTFEVEVESLDQLRLALNAAADVIMLDNFNIDDLQQAVKLNAGRAKLEASGGINEESLVRIAETGVDYISIGALTKDCKAVDLSLLFT
jgi:nicotinate-nucleotide pyrophosphorylase (carboxylating)